MSLGDCSVSQKHKPKVAVYGGSFDPPHFSHKAIVDYVVQSHLVDQVWLVPCGERADKKLIFTPEQRFNLVCDMVGQKQEIKVIRKETDNKQMIPSYTLMKQLQKENPHLDFHFLIGSDLIDTIQSWHFSEKFVEEIKFMVFFREGYSLNTHLLKHFELVDFIIAGMSSSEIKKVIRDPTMTRGEKLEFLEKRTFRSTINLLLQKDLI